jgi:hypothetical protein
MTDSDPQQEPTRPVEPLGYYHATGPSPASKVGLAFALIAGLGVGGVGVTAAGIACGFGVLGAQDKSAAVIATAAFGVAALGCVGAIVWHVRRGRQLVPERRSRGGRFFLLGLLIGCGVAALAQGICFGAVANS